MNFESAVQEYLAEEPDEANRIELHSLLNRSKQGNPEASRELQDRFSGLLQFGTAGLRAPMEAGTMRMNRVVVAKAAYALGQFLQSSTLLDRPVIVGYDARINSKIFAEYVASVLSGMSIKIAMFEEPIATPICAFSLLELNGLAAVMITASHNPPRDNGLKIYLENGAQVINPYQTQIANLMNSAPSVLNMKMLSLETQVSLGLRTSIKENTINSYFKNIANSRLHIRTPNNPLKIVYTPLHGVGLKFALRSFHEAGFENIHVVSMQAQPDGNFPTLKHSPNPEEPGVMDLARDLALEVMADLIVANDPDVDRLAVMVPARDGNGYVALSGNEIGFLLGEDALVNTHTTKKKLAVSTIVSSRMLKAMAVAHNATYIDAFTGFANIANAALNHEDDFVFGYEEALGYLVSFFVHDKDGICAAVRFAELYADLKSRGLTVFDELDRIALTYGLHATLQWSVASSSQINFGDIDTIAGELVTKRSNERNVLIFETNSGGRFIVRASGTEPKIKMYMELVAHPKHLGELARVRTKLVETLNIEKIRLLKLLFGP